MPQPAITGSPLVFKFGNQGLPNGQGTMTNINLNDGTNWQWQAFQGDGDFYQHSVGQLVWRARSTFLGQDAKSRLLTTPMRYQETGAGDFGAALAKLSQAGQQQITFDNSTAILAKLQAVKKRVMLKKFSPFYWGCDLEWLCPEPWFKDLSASTLGSTALNSGSATTFNITYAGSVFCEPVWTLNIPIGNAVAITSFVLSNVTSGETLTISFPGNLPASTAATVTIDSGAMTVKDANGVNYDATGSFPNLYGPAGQVNAMSATLTPASGTATGCTLTGSWNPRWEI